MIPDSTEPSRPSEVKGAAPLAPYFDFFGTRRVYEGDNIICMHQRLQKFRPNERSEAFTLIVRQLRKNGWDARILTYDHASNPEINKMNIVIHKVGNVIQKENPKWNEK